MIRAGLVEEVAYELNVRAATQLPDDYLAALEKVFQAERNGLARVVLGEMLASVPLQRAERRPICADVGLPRYYVKLANDVSVEGGLVGLEGALRRAVRRVTENVPLRSNRCHPLTRVNPGTNVGVLAPSVDYSVEPGAGWIDLTATHKGGAFGTDFRMLFAGEGVPAIKRFVLQAVGAHGRRGLACQPAIVGVGIGGTKDQAMSIGKMACMLRTVGDRHPDPTVAALERELLDLVNSAGIGTMGLPGSGYAVDLHVEIAYTHSAFLPVAVHHFCQALRRATVRIYEDGRHEFRTDPRWFTDYYRREGEGSGAEPEPVEPEGHAVTA